MRRSPFSVLAAVGALAALALIPQATAGYPGTNGMVAFVSAPGGYSEIFAIDTDGSGLVNLTNNPGVSDFSPAWSPDGRRIAYSVNQPGPGCCQLWVVNADGTGKRMIADPGGQPSWSPTGKQIVFQGYQGGRLDISVVSASGGKVRRIFRGGDPTDPEWSPAGSKIVFIQPGKNDVNSLWVMSATGKSPKKLATGPGLDSPDWSPDGKQISFDRGLRTKVGIYVINATGGKQQPLTRQSVPCQAAAFSPDGAQFVVSCGRTDAKTQLFMMNVSGTGPKTRIPTGRVGNFQPTWQPLP